MKHRRPETGRQELTHARLMSKSPIPVRQARVVLIALVAAIAATVIPVTPHPVAERIELFAVGKEFGPQELAVSANGSLLAFRNGGIGTQHSLCVVSAEDGKLTLRQVVPGGTKARFIDKSDELLVHCLRIKPHWRIYDRTGVVQRAWDADLGLPLFLELDRDENHIVSYIHSREFPQMFAMDIRDGSVLRGPRGFYPRFLPNAATIRYFYEVSHKGVIYRAGEWNLRTNNARLLGAFPQGTIPLSYSSNGEFVAVKVLEGETASHLELYRIGPDERLTQICEFPGYFAVFSPTDPGRLAIWKNVPGDSSLWLMRLNRRLEIQRLSEHLPEFHSFAWAADGSKLAWLESDKVDGDVVRIGIWYRSP